MLSRRNMHARHLLHTFILLILVTLIPSVVQAEDSDETLKLLGQQVVVNDPVVGRLPRQISQTPENTTVITSLDIEALNAHTLIDILATIPGIQLENQTGSVNVANTRIQGANYGHVLVLLDDIPYSNVGDNYSDIGLIPARIIERVEIVKGAASSAWGQALGGVINVITKSPDTDRRGGGMASAAQGQKDTHDVGGELSGTVERFGYYLSSGKLGSDGFHPNTGFDNSNAHARLTFDLPNKGQAGLLLNYSRYERGDFAFVPLDYQSKEDGHRLISGLSLRQPFGNGLELSLNSFYSNLHMGIDTATLLDKQQLQNLRTDESQSGVGAKLLWRKSANLLVAGIDFQRVKLAADDSLISVDILDRQANRWGFYLNDTFSSGPVTISSGARYDLTDSSGNQFSPSIGLTWQLADSTLIRGYTAKGFGLPRLNIIRGSEKVWTSQIGFESTVVPYLWLKGTLFRNDTDNISVYDSQNDSYLTERQIMQGFEVEMRTAEVLNLSLQSGYTFVDARRSKDDSVVRDVPTNTLQLGIRYDDHKRFKALLTGRHISWNADAYHNGSYQGMLWDLHLNATPFSGDLKGAELFFSIRNIFNGSQYLDEIYRNNGRWAEGGVRFRF